MGKAVIEQCVLCGTSFQYGVKQYDGQYLPPLIMKCFCVRVVTGLIKEDLHLILRKNSFCIWIAGEFQNQSATPKGFIRAKIMIAPKMNQGSGYGFGPVLFCL
ncbi:hypothetical protein GWO09_27860 [candidate division KSB1 bacterium]|nr:hypothetical protein [candidate division KSB1 bacterium]